MNRPIRILALIHIVFASLVLAVGLVLVLSLASGPQDLQSQAALQFVLPFYLLIGVCNCLPALIGGLGLLAGRAWARWLIVVVSIPLLFAFPIGTALAVFSFWALFGSEASVSRPSILLGGRAKLLLVMAGTGAAIALALTVGFLVNLPVTRSAGPVLGPNGIPVPIDRPHEPIELSRPASNGAWTGYGPLAIGFCAIAGVLVIQAPALSRRWNRRQIQRRQIAEFAKRNTRRIAELEADPIRRGYAQRVAGGEAWSDAQIDYDLDPDAVASCPHLQPVEHAMRRAGVAVRLVRPLQLDARCRIDAASLERHGLLQPPALYREYYESERSYEDNPTSRIVCQACASSFIWVVHPKALGPDPVLFGG